jgi:hypothetical protein
MKHIFLAAFAACGSVAVAQQPSPAQSVLSAFGVVTYAAPFLLITPDARAAGLGDNGVALSPGVHSHFLNAAQLPFSETRVQAGITYTPWLRALVPDINHAAASFSSRIGETQAIGAGIRYMSYGSITTVSSGGGINQFRPNEFAVDASYAHKLGASFAASMTARFISSTVLKGAFPSLTGTIPMKTGLAAAADIAIYHQVEHDLFKHSGAFAWGLQVADIGTKISYSDSLPEYSLPATVTLGGRATVKGEHHHVSLSAGLQAMPSTYYYPYAGDARFIPSAGLEYDYATSFFLRTGASLEKDNEYMTFGAGIRYNVFRLDFSYLYPFEMRNPLEKTLRFTLAFCFDKFKTAPMPQPRPID